MKPRIVFFGSDKYSLIVLNQLKKDKRFEIVKTVADKKDLKQVKLIKPKPLVGVLASFGAIIPPEILNFFPKGILNLHPSLLPKYQGPSPVQTCLASGDKKTGITIIKLDEKIDHGPIVSQTVCKIRADDTTESLYERLFNQGTEVLKTILPVYLQGKIKPRKQNHRQATYTKKLTRQDGKINWQKTAAENERFIRAMFSWPGAWTEAKLANQPKAKRLKIHQAHLKNKRLVLDKVQLEGKKPVTYKQFHEGYPEAKIIGLF